MVSKIVTPFYPNELTLTLKNVKIQISAMMPTKKISQEPFSQKLVFKLVSQMNITTKWIPIKAPRYPYNRDIC